ncbi:MAG: hypothetical protein KatS3mg109_0428 [Pirellulaceae bacterium]|nr:MAG: hypothetical protein KatS3mg109_0428 [Pirellulaceae bacterium]
MADLDLLRFHAQSLREYAALWFDSDARQEVKVSGEEAAYHLCEHAAMLSRYTGCHTPLRGLVEQSPDQRRSLVLAVCRYLMGLTLTTTARRLISVDVLDGDQLTQLEDLLIERHGMEEVLALVSRLSADLLDDLELRRSLAMARSIVAELDDVLWERPDALSVACRALAGLRAQLAEEPDMRIQWWFGKAVDLDETFEEASLQELLNNAAAPLRTGRRGCVIRLGASLFARERTTFGLAAADVPSGHRAPSLVALIPELPGMRVVVTHLDSDAYQFVFIDDATRERSTRLDGHRLIARCGEEDRATSPITAGVAMLREGVLFDSCRIETADGRPVGTLILDTSSA